jgi:hypothetical protein
MLQTQSIDRASTPTSMSNPKPTVEEVRRWNPDSLVYSTPTSNRSFVPGVVIFVNLSPPIDGATFIDRGGDYEYWMFERGLSSPAGRRLLTGDRGLAQSSHSESSRSFNV